MTGGIFLYGMIKIEGLLETEVITIGNQVSPDLFLVRFKDIAAVASSHDLVAYDTHDREQTIKDLALHQLVLEKLMERFPTVPVKFATVIENKDEVLVCLEKGYTLLSSLLEKRAGEIELDVAAWWELPEIIPELSRHNDLLRQKQQEIAFKGSEVSIEDKVVLGQYVQQALHAEKIKYLQQIVQILKAEAEDMCLHNLVDDHIIFNGAFLLKKHKEVSFHHTLATLDQSLQSRIHFRVVGPLPTYSFSTIQVRRIDPRSVEAAKKILDLSAEMTIQNVHDAYHKLAKAYHPDVNGGKENREFQQIHSAYLTLKNFMDNGFIYLELYQYTQ